MTDIRTVAVIGAGTMGAGIAQVFARAGFDVLLQDTSSPAIDGALATIAGSLQKFEAKGAVTADQREAALARIHAVTEIGALARADLAIEAVVEQAAVKRGVFAALDAALAPHALLASNTSSISIASLAAATSRPDRVFGMHFMNPVPLMPLVELVRGARTSPTTMAAAAELCERLGKTAVVAADRPGFIANRILMPMINEAAYALAESVGTAEDIDTVMKLGMHHPMGPLALADLIGLDVCVAILDVMRDGLGDRKYEACPLLREKVATGDLGRKTGRGFYSYQ